MTLTFSIIYQVTETFIDTYSTTSPRYKVAVVFRKRIVEKADQYLSGIEVRELNLEFLHAVASEVRKGFAASDELCVALADLVAAIKAEAKDAKA